MTRRTKKVRDLSTAWWKGSITSTLIGHTLLLISSTASLHPFFPQMWQQLSFSEKSASIKEEEKCKKTPINLSSEINPTSGIDLNVPTSLHPVCFTPSNALAGHIDGGVSHAAWVPKAGRTKSRGPTSGIWYLDLQYKSILPSWILNDIVFIEPIVSSQAMLAVFEAAKCRILARNSRCIQGKGAIQCPISDYNLEVGHWERVPKKKKLKKFGLPLPLPPFVLYSKVYCFGIFQAILYLFFRPLGSGFTPTTPYLIFVHSINSSASVKKWTEGNF